MDIEQPQYRRQFFEHDLCRVSRHEAAHATVAAWAWGEGVAEVVLTPHLTNSIFTFNVVKGRTDLRRPEFLLMNPSDIERPDLDGPTAMLLVALAGPVMDCILADDRSAHSITHQIVERAVAGDLSLTDLEGIGHIDHIQEPRVAQVLHILTQRWGRVDALADAAASEFRQRYAAEIAEFIDANGREELA